MPYFLGPFYNSAFLFSLVLFSFLLVRLCGWRMEINVYALPLYTQMAFGRGSTGGHCLLYSFLERKGKGFASSFSSPLSLSNAAECFSLTQPISGPLDAAHGMAFASAILRVQPTQFRDIGNSVRLCCAKSSRKKGALGIGVLLYCYSLFFFHGGEPRSSHVMKVG